MSIPVPDAVQYHEVTWNLGHAKNGTASLAGARGRVKFEATATAVAYSEATVLPAPVETPVIGGVMTPVDLLENVPGIWNWKVTPSVGVQWVPFHIDVLEPVNLSSAATMPGAGPVRVVKGDRGAQGASLTELTQINDETLRAVIEDPLTGTSETETFTLPRGPVGPYGGTEVTDPQVASYVLDETTSTSTALDVAFVDTPRRVVHGHIADFPRPAGDRLVEWFGSVEPTEMRDGDALWLFEEPFSGLFEFATSDLSGWTPWWNATGSWSVEAGELTSGTTITGRRVMTVDAAGTPLVGEVVTRLRASHDSSMDAVTGGLAARVSNATTAAANHYGLVVLLGELHIARTASGTYTSQAATPMTFAEGDYYWLRLRVEENTVKGRAWADTATEPSEWMVTYTDPDPLPAGALGVFASHARVQRWDRVGVAVEHVTAPKGA